MKDLLLSEELMRMFHQWHQIVLFLILGGLLGVASSTIWPATFRATTEIYVGLDAFRAVESRYVGEFTNVEFRFPDDFKHWQMLQLNALAFSDEYLIETLARIENQELLGEQVDLIFLREVFSVHWRDAGKWQLVVETRQAELAVELVEAWKDVILEKTNLAINSSQNLFLLDLQLQALETEHTRLDLEVSELKAHQENLERIQNELAANTENDLLSESTYTELAILSVQAATLVPGWDQLVKVTVSPNTPTQEVSQWIDLTTAIIAQREGVLHNQLDNLVHNIREVMELWRQTLSQGRGLAATIIVDEYSEIQARVSQPRSPGTTGLIGSFFGLLVWGLVRLVQITRRQDW
jgi:hypothetical protein